MTKEQAVTYLHNHIDLIEVVTVATAGITVSLVNEFEQWLRITSLVVVIAYTCYKWYRLYRKK